MSQEHKVPSISVGGSDQLYGGKIYYFDYKFNFGQGPNILQVNVINKDGNYNAPKPDMTEKKPVKLDNIDFGEMVVFKYKKRVSSQGNILEIYFVDATYILDKVFIGLTSRHGWLEAFNNQNKNFTEKTFEDLTELRNWGDDPKKWSSSSSDPFQMKNKNFYLIGRLFHPCDKNKDNLIDFDEATNFDHCDPCPSCPDDKYETRCQELSYTQIFEVGYSLKDMENMFKKDPVKVDGFEIKIDIGSIRGGKSENGKDPIKDYYRNYSGSLREVLTAWCNDFGLVWWYDSPNKTIKFLDISSKEIKLDAAAEISKYKNSKLISYEQEKTAEATVQNGVISWYQRGGEKTSYTCEKASTVVLSALYGADYLGNKYRKVIGSEEALNSNHDVLGSILGAYNPTLRNAFWQRQAYNLRKAEDYIPYVVDLSASGSSSSSSSSSVALGENPNDNDDEAAIDDKTIYEMGNLNILAIVANPPVEANSTFHDLVKNKWDELSTNETLSEYEMKRIREKKAWFIVTYIDEDALQQRLDMEGEVFDFIGKFFVREHLFRLCGITGNDEFVKNNTHIESADGSAQIYSKKDGIGTNPLSKYKYYKSGFLGCVMGTGNVSTGEVAKPVQSENADTLPGTTQGWQIEKYKGNVVTTDTDNTYRDAERQAGTLFSQKYANKQIPRIEQTAIVLERDAIWKPEVNVFQEAYDDYIAKKYGDSEWKLYGTDGVPVSNSEWLEKALNDLKNGKSGKIKIFIVYPEQIKLEIKPFKESEFKESHQHTKDRTANATRKTLKRIGGKFSPETPIGLLSNDNHLIKIDQFLQIETPPHTFIKEGAGGAKELVSKSFSVGGNDRKLCDQGVKNNEIKFRKPAYRVYVSQSFSQNVTLPRIQTGIDSGMNAPDTVMKLNVLYNGFTDDDLFAFTGSGVAYGCVPNMKYLTGLHGAYTSRVYSNTDSDENLSIEIKGLPDFVGLEAEVKKGLSSFSIQLNEEGSRSTIQYNTVLIKSISSDLLKWWNTRTYNSSARTVQR
jgi:hypothetical protein